MLEAALVAGGAVVSRPSIAAAAVGIVRVPAGAAPSGVVAEASRAAVLADPQSPARNSGLGNAFARLGGERHSDLDEGEGRENVDVAEVGAAESAFVRERADDGPGLDPVFVADLHPVANRVLHLATRLTLLAGPPLALRAEILRKTLGLFARHRAGVAHGEGQERHRQGFEAHRTGLRVRIALGAGI